MHERVVVTGMGVISPLGNGVQQLWDALCKGKSGIDRIDKFDVKDFPTQIAGCVKDFIPENYIDKKEARRMDRFTQFAVAACKQAIENAKLDLDNIDKERFGVILGTGIGGIETLENQVNVFYSKGPSRISPFMIPMMIANMAAGQISIDTGAKGTNFTIVTACAASANALGEALNAIRSGVADIIISGGSEAPITPTALAGFCSMKAMSSANDIPCAASRPFDAKRDGFVMSEGAGILILESYSHAKARGAHIFGEIAGYGVTADAYHITAPSPLGEGGARAMKGALINAKVQPSSVGYINAHGTSTPYNDKYETYAIKSVFGDHAFNVPISSTKSMTGHLLGAAGAIEAIISIKTLMEQFAPPTINYTNPDPECDLDYVPNEGRKISVNYALSNSFGFGGHNASLLFRKSQD
jgi:3-oxoacyl-[acyl-carrier-protein] synthase II